MLKTALFDCEINEKCRSVDGVRGICPPHPGAFDTSIVPTPGEFAVQGKKNANARKGGSITRKIQSRTVSAAQTAVNTLRFGESGSVRTRSDRNNRELKNHDEVHHDDVC